MPQRTLHLDRPLADVWKRLQEISSWEGVGGLTDLRQPHHDAEGNLSSFSFSIETPLGTIRDQARVISDALHGMTVVAEAKGLEVAVNLKLTAKSPSTTTAEFDIEARSTNFLSRPLAGTLRHTLESSIDREARKMTDRLEQP